MMYPQTYILNKREKDMNEIYFLSAKKVSQMVTTDNNTSLEKC